MISGGDQLIFYYPIFIPCLKAKKIASLAYIVFAFRYMYNTSLNKLVGSGLFFFGKFRHSNTRTMSCNIHN